MCNLNNTIQYMLSTFLLPLSSFSMLFGSKSRTFLCLLHEAIELTCQFCLFSPVELLSHQRQVGIWVWLSLLLYITSSSLYVGKWNLIQSYLLAKVTLFCPHDSVYYRRSVQSQDFGWPFETL